MIVGVSGAVFKAMNFSHDMERVRYLGYVEDDGAGGIVCERDRLCASLAGRRLRAACTRSDGKRDPCGCFRCRGVYLRSSVDAGLIFCLSNPEGSDTSLKECLSNDASSSRVEGKGIETRAAIFLANHRRIGLEESQ